MKKFKPLYTFASLWKQFVLFTKNWRRKPTGELVNKDKLELEDVTANDITANDIDVRDIKCRKVTATGEIKTSSKVTATGEVSGSRFVGETDMSKISNNNHYRFVEGDITMETITGVTQTYGKWSLSGTHLMIVLCLTVDGSTSLTASDLLCNVDLPLWIKQKIVPIFSFYVLTNTYDAWNTGGSRTDFAAYLTKQDGAVKVIMGANFNTSTTRYVRMQFDLLIDTAPDA